MTPSRTSWAQIAGWLGASDRSTLAVAAMVGAGLATAEGAALHVAVGYGFLCANALAIALIDARHFLVPDRLSLPLLPVGLAVSVAGGAAFVPVFAMVVGLWAGLSLFARLARAFRGAEAFGQGDVKLIAVAGAWLRPEWIAPFIVTSALGAIASYLIRKMANRSPHDPRIAFGATLAPVLACLALLQLYFHA